MDDLIYLDNSATSFPKPQVVYDYMKEFYQSHGVSPGRSGFDKALEAEEVVHSTRRLLASLFNGTDPNRLTFNSTPPRPSTASSRAWSHRETTWSRPISSTTPSSVP